MDRMEQFEKVCSENEEDRETVRTWLFVKQVSSLL